MSDPQKQNLDRLLTYCIRIDELAFSLCLQPEQELAKSIAEDDVAEMTLPQRRKQYTAIRVAMNRWLINNEPWDSEHQHEQWRAEFNGFLTNLRVLADACNGRIPLPKPDEPESDQDSDLKHWFWEQQGRCNGCGGEFPPRVFEVDHIVPLQLGGNESMDNKQLLCPSCNRKKGQLNMDQLWKKLIDEGTIWEIPRNVPRRIRVGGEESK